MLTSSDYPVLIIEKESMLGSLPDLSILYYARSVEGSQARQGSVTRLTSYAIEGLIPSQREHDTSQVI